MGYRTLGRELLTEVARAREIDEAKLVSGLVHANIVQIHDFGCIDDRLYHTMEYVQGLNISEIVREMKEHGQPVPVVRSQPRPSRSHSRVACASIAVHRSPRNGSSRSSPPCRP